MEVTTPSIEGLTSIINYLGLLDSELQSPATELLSQIQADVSSLDGRVRSLAQAMDCPIQARTRGEILNHSDSLFPESWLYLSLMKVQRYLEKFLLNKGKLKVCWEVMWDLNLNHIYALSLAIMKIYRDLFISNT